MSAKDYRGKEIIVTVGGGPDDPNKTKSPRAGRGMIPPPRRKGGPLKRRGGPGTINFHDGGSILSGSVFVDRDISFQTAQIGSNWPIALEGPGSGHWATIAAGFLAIADKQTNLKRVTTDNAVDYQISIAINGGPPENIETANPNFTDAGYKLPGTVSRLQITTVAHWYSFDTGNDADVKVTDSASYAAAEVPLSIKGSSRIYFQPALMMWSAVGQITIPDNFGASGGFFDLFPRDLLGEFNRGEVVNGSESDARFNSLLSLILSRGETRSWETLDQTTSSPSGPVPPRPTLIAGVATIEARDGDEFGDEPAFAREGTLLAIVESGGRTFYIWNRDDTLLPNFVFRFFTE